MSNSLTFRADAVDGCADNHKTTAQAVVPSVEHNSPQRHPDAAVRSNQGSCTAARQINVSVPRAELTTRSSSKRFQRGPG